MTAWPSRRAQPLVEAVSRNDAAPSLHRIPEAGSVAFVSERALIILAAPDASWPTTESNPVVDTVSSMGLAFCLVASQRETRAGVGTKICLHSSLTRRNCEFAPSARLSAIGDFERNADVALVGVCKRRCLNSVHA